jgi:hypothetical protein
MTAIPVVTDDPRRSGPPDSDTQKKSALPVGAVLAAVAWIATRFIVSILWGVTKGTTSLSVSSWQRWDSANYIAIAAHGLRLQRCTALQQAAFLTKQCGTVGWLPGYPWVMRGLHMFGLSYAVSGVVISGLAFYFVLYVVWWQWARDLSAPRALVLLLTFAVFPGSVYNFAVFPLSLALLLCTGAVVAAVRQRFILMGVLLLAGGLCYPTAWFAALGLMVGVGLAAWNEGTRAIVTRVALASLGLFSIVVLAFWEPSGHPFIYFSAKSPAVPLGFPGSAFVDYAVTGTEFLVRLLSPAYAAILQIQTWLAIGVVGLCAWMIRPRRPFKQHLPDSTVLYPVMVGVAVVAGLILLTTAGAWYRSIVLAAPAVVVLKRLPLLWQCLILTCLVVVTGVVSYGFFKASLV